MLRAKCPHCGSDLDELRLGRWRTFDRTAWCFGMFGMGVIVMLGIATLYWWLAPATLHSIRSR